MKMLKLQDGSKICYRVEMARLNARQEFFEQKVMYHYEEEEELTEKLNRLNLSIHHMTGEPLKVETLEPLVIQGQGPFRRPGRNFKCVRSA